MAMPQGARSVCPLKQPVDRTLLELRTLLSSTGRDRILHYKKQEKDGSRIGGRFPVSIHVEA